MSRDNQCSECEIAQEDRISDGIWYSMCIAKHKPSEYPNRIPELQNVAHKNPKHGAIFCLLRETSNFTLLNE